MSTPNAEGRMRSPRHDMARQAAPRLQAWFREAGVDLKDFAATQVADSILIAAGVPDLLARADKAEAELERWQGHANTNAQHAWEREQETFKEMARVKELEAENRELRTENTMLKDELAAVKGQLAGNSQAQTVEKWRELQHRTDQARFEAETRVQELEDQLEAEQAAVEAECKRYDALEAAARDVLDAEARYTDLAHHGDIQSQLVWDATARLAAVLNGQTGDTA